MTPELWQRLKPLFAEALQRPAALRDAYVAEACAGDPQLHNELQALLVADLDATGPLGVQTDLTPALHAALACFQPGQLILQRFRIIRFISGGGMGEVYEAEDLLLGKVALKTVRADIADSPDALRRLRQEVQLARCITGSAICRIHEFFLMPADRPHGPTAFISMEYIEGETLATRLQTRGPLSCAEALRIALAICDGLCLIHTQNIIHRDLKTTNIMLCGPPGAERTVLMDFGLAHAARHHRAPGELPSALDPAHPTHSSAAEPGIVGTPAYMAPEQFSGESVTPATDLYALGIVLYELATGVQPYSASTPYAAAARRGRKPPTVSTVRRDFPHQWDRVIDRCLQYEPTDRFQSAEEVAESLSPGTFNLHHLWNDRRGLVHGSFAVILCAVAWLSLLAWQALTIYRPSSETARFYHNGVEALDDGTYLKATRALNAAVERDPRFAMGHVRLAEAWNSLDFQVAAQQELLLASPGEHRLSPLDALQLQAIRSEVTGDFHAATEAREQLIAKLPQDQLSAAYVELGFARERDAQPDGALADYLKASSLDSENASAFLHAAVLESRLNRSAEGQHSFDRAEAIYRTQINQEGLANLHYERGYAANVMGNSADATKLLKQSLLEAQQIPSVQLQIRTLQQLSSATNSYDATQAAAYATDAIRLARENRLDSWAAIGLVRLAAAQLREGNLKQARDTTNEGLRLAHETKQIRVEALANIQLANLENQEGHSDLVIGPATAARDYYQKHGFFNSAAKASILIGRAQRDQDLYEEALKTAETSKALAIKADERELQQFAEELSGQIWLLKENLPVALAHFQHALAFADSRSSKQYQEVRICNVLWRLGRYREFEVHLDFDPATTSLREGALVERVLSLVSSRHFVQATTLLNSFSVQYPQLAEDVAKTLLPATTVAEAELHHEAAATKDLTLMETEEAGSATPAFQYLASARVNLALGRAAEAEAQARSAAQWFRERHLVDSELQSSAIEAQAARREGHMSTAADLEARCVDILREIRDTWPPDDAKMYVSRPDIKALLRKNT